MKEFGHFFEFFAALNSAYIVSTEFLSDLVRINDKFGGLQSRLDDTVNIHETNLKRLQNYTTSKSKKKNGLEELERELPAFDVKYNQIDGEIIDIIKKVKACVDTNHGFRNFNLLCLFGSLYCILMLILNGFGYYSENTLINRESFLIFNIISISFLFFLFQTKKSPSYGSIIVFFLSSVILSFGSYHLLSIDFIPQCNYDFNWFNYFVAITVPTGHFIYFFIKSHFNYKTKAEIIYLKKEIKKLNSQCNGLAAEIGGGSKSKRPPVIEGLESPPIK